MGAFSHNNDILFEIKIHLLLLLHIGSKELSLLAAHHIVNGFKYDTDNVHFTEVFSSWLGGKSFIGVEKSV